MKSTFPVFLVVFAAALAGCSSVPEVVPVSEQSTWVIDADKDRGQPAIVRKGESREEVIAQLGAAPQTRRLAGQAGVEVLRYRRTVVGPPAIRQVSTVTGIATIQAPIHYTDIVDVFLEKGVVVAVSVDRRKQELRSFGQSD